jgi:hypothetical protein
MKNKRMKYTVFLLLIILLFGCTGSQKDTNETDLKIKIPTKWIEKLRKYDYKENNVALLKEFEEFIKPNILTNNHGKDKLQARLNPMFVDLDNDAEEELILLMGWTNYEPTLTVFKKINCSWYLIFMEDFMEFYDEPELQISNNYSPNKTFYIHCLYERGSGIYCDGYHFYKLINNKVSPCLVLVNHAHILGWGLYLNQIVNMSFNFNSATADEIRVRYEYNFFPGAVYEDDVPWEADHEDIPFVKGVCRTSFYWNDTTFTYKPETNYNKAEKIACFGNFGNDTLFVKAFAYEIQQTLQNGTKEQKRLLQNYLDIVEKEKRATAPTGELVEVGSTNTLTFYGTKNKEK